MSLKKRLQKHNFDTIGLLYVGSSGRSQVTLVRRSDCDDCKMRDRHFQCASCGSPFAAKSVPPRMTSLIGINEGMLERLLKSPVPEAAVVYHERWNDKKKGDIILMNAHQSTLQNLIKMEVDLTEVEWVVIMFGLFTRLANAHENGLLHGDLKPSNVLLDATTPGTVTPEGVHIADFGLIYYHKYKTATTRSNIVGSPPYLAPEVLIYGESSITPRSDIWAAGCIGFELCNGEKLHDAHGTHPASGIHPVEVYLKNLRSERIRELSDVPSRFSNVVRSVLKRCLEFESSNRPTAIEMRDYLLSGVQAWARITLENPSTLRSNPPTTIWPIDNTLAHPQQDITDDEWLSVLHNDAIPNHNESVSATGNSVNPTPEEDELTRQFESQVISDDKLEEDDLSWTTGEEKSISHRRLIDRGGSGEVHELFNSRTTQMFARKIIRPFGDVKMTDITKEFTVVQNLCKPGVHQNVVAVLGCGRLPSAPLYFIDMELCELNLGTYISRKWTRELEQSVPFLSEIHSSATREISQMGEIMTDIGRGLEYIHSHEMIHRDLKPQNVLYSCQQNAWKIADFGLTTDGTSRHALTTRYARGTSTYRAPELVPNKKFNNKVDIWAVGCIWYEVVFLQKAFSSDYEVSKFGIGEELDFPFDLGIFQNKRKGSGSEALSFEPLKRIIERVIRDMMKINHLERPSARDVNSTFKSAFDEDFKLSVTSRPFS